MPATLTETLKNGSVTPPGTAFSQLLSGDVAMSMLLEVQCGVTELKVDVKHLTTTTESIKGKVEILKAKVEILVNGKNGVLGGVAVLAVLWGIFKALSGYVHIGPMVTPASAVPAVAQSLQVPNRPSAP
jgi:hypothetical protein